MANRVIKDNLLFCVEVGRSNGSGTGRIEPRNSTCPQVTGIAHVVWVRCKNRKGLWPPGYSAARNRSAPPTRLGTSGTLR